MKQLYRPRWRPALSFALALVLGGCTQGQPRPASTAPPATDLVTYTGQLANRAHTERAQAVERARAAWNAAPSPDNRARLGLAQAQPGQAGYAPEQAADHLAAALAAEGASFSTEDRALLEFVRLQARQASRYREQLQQARAHGQQLSDKLERAERKLRAIGDIERDLDAAP